ncbi:dCTP deaminase [Candidatus Woesearchaeota archaeon]|jgi:dCTP deaminase|nr:dCTP deaminase [Candidatus Woesearchaeota archaeon]MBT6518368.1 dCTP deaminase [Candidatus Woesearchaeota archaeon]MBT7368729.1 dCTP deaminase [Candidatus Woesearchaeota archaeon]
MILTKEKILEEIKKKRIKISGFKKENLGPASYDLTLASHFRVFKENIGEFNVTNKADHKKITRSVTTKTYTLMPGELIHGITKEKVTIPEDMCGWLQGRSRFARIGLMVHLTASFMQPGIANQQVLEIYNAGPVPLKLHPGTKVCQLIFQRCEGKAKYKGRFSRQKKP